MSASSGRNARTLADSGADEHVCPTNFASATPLSGTLCGAQGHMIEAHCTRTVYMRHGLEGQSVGAEFRVTNVKSPSLSMEKLVKQGCRFETGPTGCKMSKGDSSVTLDVVKKSLRVDVRAYTTAEGARNANARLIAPVVSELPSSSSGPTTPSFERVRAARGSSAEYSDSSSPVEDMRKRLRELRAPVWGTTHLGLRVFEREVIERRHLDEEALVDRRRDLESAIDPAVPKTLKGPDAPTESERAAPELTHPQQRVKLACWNVTRGSSLQCISQ